MTPELVQDLVARLRSAAATTTCRGCQAVMREAVDALQAVAAENKLLRDNERFKDGLIHYYQRRRAEQAEQERDDWRLSFETVNDALGKAEAKLAQAPPDSRAEAVRVLEDIKASLSETRQEIATLPENVTPTLGAFDYCLRLINDKIAALRAEGEGGNRG